MSDKTSDKTSDKQYKITLTEKQLGLIGKAVEIMLRTGMGQTYDLAEWLTLVVIIATMLIEVANKRGQMSVRKMLDDIIRLTESEEGE